MSNKKNNNINNYIAYKNLQLLSKAELKEFGKWIESDFCNSNKALRRLFLAIQPYFPRFEHPKLNRDFLYGKLYPGKELNKKVLLNAMSLLSKEVERFLVFKEVEKDKKQYRRNFIKVLNDRNATNRFIHASDRFTENIHQQPTISWRALPDLIFTQIDLYYSDTTSFRQETGITPLHDAKHYLDTFHALAHLKMDVELQEKAKKVQTIEDEEGQRLRIPSENASLDLSLQLYQNWQDNVNGGLPDGFNRFRCEYEAHYKKIPPEDRQILWTYMLNECSRLYQRGQVDMLAELLSLYKLGHEEGMLTHEGIITETKFANIITVAIAEKDLDFAETMWKDYGASLPKASAKEGSIWAEAYILKYRKEYEKAVVLVDGKSFKQHVFKPRSRVLRIQCFFEQFLLGEVDLDELLKACTAFDRQMRKHYYLSETRSKAYRNFSKFLKQIARSCHDPNQGRKEIKQIQMDLKSATDIQVKKWLLEKLDEILGRGG